MGWFTSVNKEITCKFCNNKNCVSVKKVMKKGGIDPGKVLGHTVLTAVTMGLWLPAILTSGICKDIEVAEMTCGRCKTKWEVA